MARANERRQLGVIGLGVMGQGLALNAAEHGWSVVAYDRDLEKNLPLESGVRRVASIADLVAALDPPRAVLLLVPAGPAVDAVLAELLAHLTPGDLAVDGGNSFFRDTARRASSLLERGFHYMGLGISGGERGARFGPSLMPGGADEDYARMQPLFEAIAARAGGAPCVTHVGRGAAGHYVKMVHNGIEYAVMQLLAETYDVMHRGLRLDAGEVSAVYERWNDGELRSFLLEATTRVLRVVDGRTGEPLVRVVRDAAGSKGTGMWCAQDAMELGVPVPSIDAAVRARELSGLRDERRAAASLFSDSVTVIAGDRVALLERLRRAYYFGLLAAYGQGLAQLARASRAYGYGTDLGEVARIWRAGCIIRAALLEGIQAAYRAQPDLSNLLLDPETSRIAADLVRDVRAAVRDCTASGIPAPGLMSALAYLDGLRSPRLPTNLIQAQRDHFGAHGFQRIDAEGAFHSEWSL